MSELHYTVRVDDRRATALAGRDGCSYQSPGHAHEHALQLVHVLLDCPNVELTGLGPWRRAIAGGERSVELIVADRLFDPDGS